MPKYSFICSKCAFEYQTYAAASVDKQPCLDCGAQANRKMPTLNGPSNVSEVIDKYTGITHRRDQKDEVKERREEYYWTVEVPRFVASGTYSIETMLENEWIKVDDNMNVTVNNTPPHRR